LEHTASTEKDAMQETRKRKAVLSVNRSFFMGFTVHPCPPRTGIVLLYHRKQLFAFL
jgi:hypothetical protein